VSNDDQDWRLQVDLAGSADAERLLGELRSPHDTAYPSMGDDVVLTHDGSTLFAYAASENSLQAARKAIEAALGSDERSAKIRASHWEQARMSWHQTDRPLADNETNDPGRANGNNVTTRTLVCTVGKLIRASFEQVMTEAAQDYVLKCEIIEHPHLLSTQVAFRLTGSQQSINEFADCLKAEARATIRVDPGLFPFALP
jgi:hypothetical protein